MVKMTPSNLAALRAARHSVVSAIDAKVKPSSLRRMADQGWLKCLDDYSKDPSNARFEITQKGIYKLEPPKESTTF